MASPAISNPVPATHNDRRKKKKKKSPTNGTLAQNGVAEVEWKSEKQQQIYSSKLLRALSQLRITGSNPDNGAPRRGRFVREVADRALAVAAKGRTRWSRAILTNRVKLKFRKVKRQRVSTSAAAAAVAQSRWKKPRVSVLGLKGKNMPAVHRKVKVLGRLVPGCRKEPLPVILEEATDYIAALEMQVRAMSALADLLSGGSSSGASSSSAPPSG